MRRSLAIIFLVIFTFQVMPMKGFGKLLCKSQNTEDVQDDDQGDDDATGLATLYSSDFILTRASSFDPSEGRHFFENKLSFIIRNAEALPYAYVTKVPAPPPDLV